MSSSPAFKTAPGHSPLSILSGNLSVTGSLVSDGDVQVDGVIEGDVTAHGVTVGGAGSVTGEVVAEVARILGRVKGRVQARSLMLMSTAQIDGDVFYETISIENGAKIKGRFGPMKSKSEVAPSSSAARRVSIVGQNELVES